MNHLRLNSILAATLIAVILAGMPLSTAADNASRRVIVGFRDTPGAEHRQLIESMGGRITYQYSIINAIAAEVPGKAIASLVGHRSVEYVEPDHVRYLTSHIIPLQAWSGSPEILPWGVEKVNANDVWDTNGDLAVDTGAVAGQGIRVAVLDGGGDFTHPDLAANWVPLADYCAAPDICDFIDNDSDPTDDVVGPFQGHGVMGSGNIAAVDNTEGVIGVAPHAKILMYRVCHALEGVCFTSAIVAALQEAIEDGAEVINMSFGGSAAARAERVAIRAAFNADIVLVASAGNGGRPPVLFPAALPEVIAVGATDITDTIASFSSFGHDIELVGPGVDVPTTTMQGLGREALFSVDSGFTPTGGRQTNPMEFSTVGTVSNAMMRYVGLGTPSEVAAECTISDPCTGQLALIQRGAITFQAKVQNAADAGFSGAVIFNNVAGNFFGTLQAASAIPAASISMADGSPIAAAIQGGAEVFGSLAVTSLDYESVSGTSFSAPHVAGVAALVRSANPLLSNQQVRAILDGTAQDLGKPSYDLTYGFGRVDALAAVNAATP